MVCFSFPGARRAYAVLMVYNVHGQYTPFIEKRISCKESNWRDGRLDSGYDVLLSIFCPTEVVWIHTVGRSRALRQSFMADRTVPSLKYVSSQNRRSLIGLPAWLVPR